jgi:hypothetical protein
VSVRQTQRGRVLVLLRDGRWHSTIEFVELGVLRCSARVHELRRRGFVIEVRRFAHRGRSAVYAYRLVSNQPEVARSPKDEPAARAEDESQLAINVVRLASEDVVELPSAEERRRIAAEARAAFERAMQRPAS